MELRVFIPEPQLGKVRLDASARVQVDAFPDRSFEARVARIDSRPQFTPREVHVPDQRARIVFAAILRVDNPAGYLKPGMPADAWIRWSDEAAWPGRFSVPE
jgi:hypothetical protein